MLTSSCQRNSSRSIMTKKYHIYWRSIACITPLSLEQLRCVPVKPSMPSTKAINLRRTSHKSVPHNAPTAPIHTPLPMTTALCGMPSARAVPKKVTGMQSDTALVLLANNPQSLMELRRPPIVNAMGRGRKLMWYKSTLRKHPLCNELFVNAVNCGTAGGTHPEEIVVDDICAPQCNEAYTIVQLPASASSKGTASLHIKVNTGAWGNVLPSMCSNVSTQAGSAQLACPLAWITSAPG